MKNSLTTKVSLLSTSLWIGAVSLASAASPLDKVQIIADKMGLQTFAPNQTDAQDSIGALAGSIISTLLVFTGIIFILLCVYAGYLWMTAHGNENQVSKAKKILQQSMIGIFIIVMAYAITQLMRGIVDSSSLFQ